MLTQGSRFVLNAASPGFPRPIELCKIYLPNKKRGKLYKLPQSSLQLFRRRLLQRRTARSSERRSRAVQRVANYARLVAAEPALSGGADNAGNRRDGVGVIKTSGIGHGSIRERIAALRAACQNV